MIRRRDQRPGLLPPVRDWTVPQLVVSCGIVFVALLPWLFLVWVIYALSSAPIGDDLAVVPHAPGGEALSAKRAERARTIKPEGVE